MLAVSSSSFCWISLANVLQARRLRADPCARSFSSALKRRGDRDDGAIVGRQIVVPLGEDIAALACLGGLDLGEQGLGGANDLEGVVQSLAIGIRFRREAEDQPATDGEEKHEEDESPSSVFSTTRMRHVTPSKIRG